MAKPKKNNELRLVRIFNAPVKLVWEAWTKDEHVNKWWGPRGFSLTTKSKDIKPGGKWIYTMHGPDGVDYPNITTYHEVEKFSKLIYDHGGKDDGTYLFQVTALFKDLGNNKTELDMTMVFESAKAAEEIKKFIKQASGESTWDRLGEYLEEQQSSKDIFIINRSFSADQKTVFKMWTDPEHISRWLPPTAASMSFISVNIKEGGGSHYKMINADGSSMFGKIEYKTIKPYDLLVYSQFFCDAEGNMTKPPFAPTWPDKMLTTVTFVDEGQGETRVTVRWEVEGAATDIERKTFHDAKGGMTMGWTGSLDKLEEALK